MFAREYHVLLPFKIKKHSRTLEQANSRIFRWEDHMHVYVQRHWMDKEKQNRNLFAQCHRSDSSCDPIQARTTGASWSSRQKIRGGKQLPTKLKDNVILSHTFPPNISSDRAIIAWTVEERDEEITFSKGTFDNTKVKTMMASNLWCILNRIWPRRAEAGEQIDLDPEHLTLTAENSETRHKLEATRCYNSQRITKRWFRRASEQAPFAWTVENIEFFYQWICDGWQKVLLFYAETAQNQQNSQSSRLQAVLDSHVTIGPVTGIEAFGSVGTLVQEVQVPSRRPVNSKCWVRTRVFNFLSTLPRHADSDKSSFFLQWLQKCKHPGDFCAVPWMSEWCEFEQAGLWIAREGTGVSTGGRAHSPFFFCQCGPRSPTRVQSFCANAWKCALLTTDHDLESFSVVRRWMLGYVHYSQPTMILQVSFPTRKSVTTVFFFCGPVVVVFFFF